MNRFERLQQRNRKATQLQKLQEEEQERESTYFKHTQKAFEHDHGWYCKQTAREKFQECLGSTDLSGSTDEGLRIPVEVGKISAYVPFIKICACCFGITCTF